MHVSSITLCREVFARLQKKKAISEEELWALMGFITFVNNLEVCGTCGGAFMATKMQRTTVEQYGEQFPQFFCSAHNVKYEVKKVYNKTDRIDGVIRSSWVTKDHVSYYSRTPEVEVDGITGEPIRGENPRGRG